MAICALITIAAGCASLPETSSPDLIAVEHQWIQALQSHDTAALDRLLDDSFVDSTFRGGLRTKHDVLTGPRAAGAYRSIRLDDMNVRRYGDTAIVTGVNVLEGPGGHDDLAHVRFTDVFMRERGRWRAVSAQETLQTPASRPPSHS